MPCVSYRSGGMTVSSPAIVGKASVHTKMVPKAIRAQRDPETGELPILLMRWKAPDYGAILRQRLENLDRIRRYPEDLPALKAYYRIHPDDFINDWGMTFDPRNADIGLPTLIPFILFPKQREWCRWVLDLWFSRKPGLCEKSRDMGISWLAMGLSCSICLFRDGVAIGVGSRKGEYVDKIGTHKPLLPKARMFMENLPIEFRGGWESWRDAPFMRVTFPATGSIISGEGGDDIGRGDRTSVYFVDESAHLLQPELVEASLSQTTNCRIDMSSVRGMNNPFARKRWEGKIDVFIFDWRHDPRKDQAWYDKQCEQLDPVVVAQEIDRDYQASVAGVVIPAAWARSCIDAREALGIAPAGRKGLALDIADEGIDKNAAAVSFGTEVSLTEEWSGKGGDIYQSIERAFALADEHEIDAFEYDADGLGAGARGDARTINETRRAAGRPVIRAIGWRGSGKVHDPEGIVEGTKGREGDKGRTNEDYYLNAKAQAWFNVRRMAMNTHRWRTQGIACSPDDILSISSACPNHMKLVAELSQATYKTNNAGKIVVNKKPDGMKSPNLADAVVIRYAPKAPPPMNITPQVIEQVMRAGLAGRRR
jgi:phage terminase large subunit